MSLIFGLLSNFISMSVGYGLRWIVTILKKRRRTRGQAALLFGISKTAKFIFPPREPSEPSILPRISIEDFMAINNLISTFILANKEPPNKVWDSEHISPAVKKGGDLILICSSKTNKATAEALKLIKQNASKKIKHLIPEFRTKKQTMIYWNKGFYQSSSYTQPETGPLSDKAIILKAQNPWAPQYKVLVVAGIRGIGTWGAAECLKKWWHPLYEAKGSKKKTGQSKTGNFVALVDIVYNEFDIKDAKLVMLKDLDIE